MTRARRLRHRYADYLRLIASRDLKLEYWDGEIFAMDGGTPAHAELSVAMSSALRAALSGCRVYSSDLKVHVESSGLSTFPDATVVYDSLRTAPFELNAATNPTIPVGGTSRPTDAYALGDYLPHHHRNDSVLGGSMGATVRPRVRGGRTSGPGACGR